MDFSPGRLLLSLVEAGVSVPFFGRALLAPVLSHLSMNALLAPWAFSPSSLLGLMALAVARVLPAPWVFSPSFPARALSGEGLPQTLLLTALLQQHPFFWVHGTMGAKRRRQSRMKFAPSHGRSSMPRRVGAERSNYSCHPSIVSNRLGYAAWTLSSSKDIMT